ncbi:MAG: transketolase C-terminal domain-containing protein, partial [Oscillospiraceae bacterium]
LVDFDGPAYVRLGRLAVPVINENSEYKFEIGKGIELISGNDITIVATGLMVSEAIKASDILKDEGINARVVNIHTIKPIDKEIIIKAAKETGIIVTVEEHNVIGGLGSAVCEVVCENFPVPVIRVGVNDVFGCSGPALELLEKFGLTADNIVKNVKSALKK